MINWRQLKTFYAERGFKKPNGRVHDVYDDFMKAGILCDMRHNYIWFIDK